MMKNTIAAAMICLASQAGAATDLSHSTPPLQGYGVWVSNPFIHLGVVLSQFLNFNVPDYNDVKQEMKDVDGVGTKTTVPDLGDGLISNDNGDLKPGDVIGIRKDSSGRHHVMTVPRDEPIYAPKDYGIEGKGCNSVCESKLPVDPD